MGRKQERGQTRFDRKPVRINYNQLLEDLNSQKETASLSLVEQTLLKQRHESEKENTKSEIQEVSREEKMRRRRQSLMNNHNNILAYSIKSNTIVHDKDCRLVKYIPDEDLNMLTGYDGSREFCDKCKRVALLRIATNNDYKYIRKYYEFFKDAVDNKTLEMFIIENNAKFRFTDENKNCIKIKVRDDKWLLKKDDQGNFSLYHNNYVRLEGNKRNFTDGYHLQVQRLKKPKSAYYSIIVICTYSYNDHIEAEHAKTDNKDNVLYGFECPKWIKRLMKEIRKIQQRKKEN